MPTTFTTVRVNTGLVDEAVRALGAKSRTEAVHLALREIIRMDRFMEPIRPHGDKLES